jgi:hypothetical protein
MQGGDRHLAGGNELPDELPCCRLESSPVRRQTEPLTPAAAAPGWECATAPKTDAFCRHRRFGLGAAG